MNAYRNLVGGRVSSCSSPPPCSSSSSALSISSSTSTPKCPHNCFQSPTSSFLTSAFQCRQTPETEAMSRKDGTRKEKHLRTSSAGRAEMVVGSLCSSFVSFCSEDGLVGSLVGIALGGWWCGVLRRLGSATTRHIRTLEDRRSDGLQWTALQQSMHMHFREPNLLPTFCTKRRSSFKALVHVKY